MSDGKTADLRLTRDDLDAMMTALAGIEAKLETVIVHAADPREPRKAAFAKAAEAFTAVSQAKALVRDVFQQIGVRPT